VVKIEKDKLKGEALKTFIAHTKTYAPRFEMALANPTLPPREEPFEYAMALETEASTTKSAVVAVN
jgi:hypothetical protein